MSLKSGQYYIASTDLGGFPIGRDLTAENPDNPNPKPISGLPKGTESPWEVEKLDDGTYTLKNGGALVGTLGRHLFAILDPNKAAHAPTQWNLVPDVKGGKPDAWIIKQGRDNGWTMVPGLTWGSYPVAVVMPLPVIPGAGPHETPTYPPEQVFVFKKV